MGERDRVVAREGCKLKEWNPEAPYFRMANRGQPAPRGRLEKAGLGLRVLRAQSAPPMHRNSREGKIGGLGWASSEGS